jgi:NAD dependent epimerase/dehydratase family
MNTALVTGGAGFVGSHACKALARAGYLPGNGANLGEAEKPTCNCHPRPTVFATCAAHFRVQLGTVSVPVRLRREVSALRWRCTSCLALGLKSLWCCLRLARP